MAWIKAKWIDAFFAALNRRFPERDRTTDGTIGDPKHATGASGHNPDDTPGVKAERQDADTKQEVRAADVDADLRDPSGITMQDVVNAVLRTPADRDRLIYIIFNGWIWRASGGWRREAYSGSDKHTKHAHFSGHPDADENGAPWTSILNLGGQVAGEYSPDTACALAIGATSAGDVAATPPGWDGSLSVFNLRAMTTGQRVSDNAPVTGEETRLYNLRVIVEEQAKLKTGLEKLINGQTAILTAINELQNGGIDPGVFETTMERVIRRVLGSVDE